MTVAPWQAFWSTPGWLLNAIVAPLQAPVPAPLGTSAPTVIVRWESVKSPASQVPAAAPGALLDGADRRADGADVDGARVAVVEVAAEGLGGLAGADRLHVRVLVDAQRRVRNGHLAGADAAGLHVGEDRVGLHHPDDGAEDDAAADDRLQG